MSEAKIRVLIVTNSLSYGGLERVVIDICRFLDPALFEPIVACIKREGVQAKLLSDAGIPVFTLQRKSKGFLKRFTFTDLKRVVREQRIDVVHTHNTGPLLDAIAARFTCFSFPRIVHTDHTRAMWPDKIKYMIFEYVASKFVSTMVAVSEEAKEKLVYYERIDPKKIVVIDNGIPVGKYVENQVAIHRLKDELDIAQFKHVIGLCVVLRKQKGIVHLLQALPDIVAEFPDLVCLIGGEGPEKLALESVAAEKGLTEHVRFIGARSDVSNILSLLDVYVLPSEWEGLPLSLLEAMAARRCIVATSVGAVPKVLKSGQCGFLVPPCDSAALAAAVIDVLKSPEMREQLAGEALTCVSEKYSAGAMASNYGAIYRQSLQM